MTPERWQQIDRLFHEALAVPSTERVALIDARCAGDEALRREVESLLSSHSDSESLIEKTGELAAQLLMRGASKFEAGQQIENYVILRQLGSGGMGDVYLADDKRLNRKIALKLLPPQYIMDVDRVRRFEQEARAASALNHPNIVTVHDIGQSNSARYMATEFVDGVTLRELLETREMSLGQTVDIAAQIASALAAAHEAEIVHRDIKPENIMLRSDGFVKVLDFGLAKLASPPAESSQSRMKSMQTDPGVVIGTVQYMSPEQTRGENVDFRTDIWSLGVILYEMLTGCLPFGGETRGHVMVSILEDNPLPLHQFAEVPFELERIVLKSLRKKREERYQTAGELALDLRNFRDELPVESRLKKLQQLETSNHSSVQSNATTVKWSKSFGTLTSTAEYIVNGIKSNRGLSAFAATTTVLLLALFVYFHNLKKVALVEPIHSLAVVSFLNEGGDADDKYLADGLSNSIVASLSRLPNLHIRLARYDGQVDPKTVGRELNVGAVLVGSLVRRGDDLIINAELIDIRDNSQLWVAQYDRKPSAILDVQKEIAEQVTSKLLLRVDGLQKQTLEKRYTTSAEAYDAYSRGYFLLARRTGAATAKSVEYFQQAIRLDPNYALAYAFLSSAYFSLPNLSDRDHLSRAKAAATKALEIDETLAEAHAALGFIKIVEMDWAGAEIALKRASDLNPNSAFIQSQYGLYLSATKRFDEAIAASKRAVELEPTSVFANRNLAINFYFARRYDEAIEHCEKTIELDPNMMTTYWWLAQAYEQKGLYEQAVTAHLRHEELGGLDVTPVRAAYASSGWKGLWRKLLELKKDDTTSPYKLAEINVRLGNKDQVFFWLEKAHEQGHINARLFLRDPQWDSIRSDPRFNDLIQRIGLQP